MTEHACIDAKLPTREAGDKARANVSVASLHHISDVLAILWPSVVQLFWVAPSKGRCYLILII